MGGGLLAVLWHARRARDIYLPTSHCCWRPRVATNTDSKAANVTREYGCLICTEIRIIWGCRVGSVHVNFLSMRASVCFTLVPAEQKKLQVHDIHGFSLSLKGHSALWPCLLALSPSARCYSPHPRLHFSPDSNGPVWPSLCRRGGLPHRSVHTTHHCANMDPQRESPTKGVTVLTGHFRPVKTCPPPVCPVNVQLLPPLFCGARGYVLWRDG